MLERENGPMQACRDDDVHSGQKRFDFCGCSQTSTVYIEPGVDANDGHLPCGSQSVDGSVRNIDMPALIPLEQHDADDRHIFRGGDE